MAVPTVPIAEVSDLNAGFELCMKSSADMVLKIEDRSFKAHSQILGAYCGVLRNLLDSGCSSPCTPSSPLTVDLSKAAGVSAAAVEELLALVYGHRDITTVRCMIMYGEFGRSRQPADVSMQVKRLCRLCS